MRHFAAELDERGYDVDLRRAHLLPALGDHQDAMVSGAWALNHSLLSHALDLGLLHPSEVLDAAEEAYRSGHAPINAIEGFVRQILG